jgi:carbon-monoxide dehydrogenase medium subunit
MHAFDYRRPSTLAEAEQALRATTGAKLLAGGQTLIPAMKLKLNRPACIVDLSAVSGLNRIRREGNNLVIGAMATHLDVATSPDVAAAVPGLARVAEGIGDPQVRNRGTIGGSLANNDPAADYPAAILALGATLKTNRRTILADEFFRGLYATALAEHEILIEIAIPTPRRFGYAKFANPASRFALVGVAVAETDTGIRVAATGAGRNGVFRIGDMEAALKTSFTPESLSAIRLASAGLTSDIHADAEYRAHMVGVLARRAVTAALA